MFAKKQIGGNMEYRKGRELENIEDFNVFENPILIEKKNDGFQMVLLGGLSADEFVTYRRNGYRFYEIIKPIKIVIER